MKTDEFIRLCIYRGISISDKTGHNWGLHDWRQFAKLTALVDYGCNFKRGKCRNNGIGYSRSNKMGCCNGCNRSFGYLRNIPMDWEYIVRIARLFNKETGFWRKGKGCVLPVELRSAVCLGYVCTTTKDHQKAKLSKPAKRLLKLLEGPPPGNIAHTFLRLEHALKNDKAEVKNGTH